MASAGLQQNIKELSMFLHQLNDCYLVKDAMHSGLFNALSYSTYIWFDKQENFLYL
jgi:hypothetical protein